MHIKYKHKRKTNKRKTNKRKTKGGMSGRTVRLTKATIRQLASQKLLPPEIAVLIEAGYSHNVINKYIMKYKEKLQKIQLVKDFNTYSDDTDDNFDATSKTLRDLTDSATSILNKTDLNPYWRDILAKIYLGLKENDLYSIAPLSLQRGIEGEKNQNYKKTEDNFFKLIKIFFNHKINEDTYLLPYGDEYKFLSKTIKDPYLGYND